METQDQWIVQRTFQNTSTLEERLRQVIRLHLQQPYHTAVSQQIFSEKQSDGGSL